MYLRGTYEDNTNFLSSHSNQRYSNLSLCIFNWWHMSKSQRNWFRIYIHLCKAFGSDVRCRLHFRGKRLKALQHKYLHFNGHPWESPEEAKAQG